VIVCVAASTGAVAPAAAHDDVNGRPHFKGTRANPTAVMKALEADAQSAQSLPSVSNFPCTDGFADIYPCHNIDLLAFLPLGDIGSGSQLGSANDIWGWTSGGREFALVGRNDGTAFVEITDPIDPVYIGKLPTHTEPSPWRDIKVYSDHAYIVSEAPSHGMQIFDLTRLLSADPSGGALTFDDDGVYSSFGKAHNLVIDEDSSFAYAVGTGTCSGGLHMVDISTPTAPSFAGCFSSDGYTHDAQCVSYTGPDTYHWGNEICIASNADTITVVDVTVKTAPVQLSRTGYSGRGYTHQAWLSEDQSLLFLNDELDEQNFRHNTRTRVWDMSDLDTPALIDTFTNSTTAIDHNLYVKGNYVFQANYRSGLRVLEIVKDSGAYVMLDERAFFDIYPSSDSANFNGAWSNYPYFPSGTIVVSGMEQGLFVLALNIPDEIAFNTPNDNDTVSGDTVPIEIFALDDGTGAGPLTVQWRVDTETWQPAGSAGGDIFTGTWDSTDASNGAHQLTAEMDDGSGTQTQTSITVQVNNSTGDDPPTASFTSHNDGDVLSGNVTLVASASDDGTVVSVTFYDGVSVIGTDSDPAGGWSTKWNTKKASQGAHTLSVQAYDGGQLSDPATDPNGTINVTVGSGGGGGEPGGGGSKGCNQRKDPTCEK
jgi:choice-of-anchor B domain-containing protein